MAATTRASSSRLVAAQVAEVFTGRRVVFEHPCGRSPMSRSGTANRINQAGGVVRLVPTTEILRPDTAQPGLALLNHQSSRPRAGRGTIQRRSGHGEQR